MSTKVAKRVKYNEGQWFAVPLREKGFALGIIVRGDFKTKGGLGYFFGPRRLNVPTATDTLQLGPSNAILITKFGDLYLVEGKWPLIESDRPFQRQDWPVPQFARIDILNNEKGVLVEYDQDNSQMTRPILETPCLAMDLVGLPQDVLAGAGAVEIKLTRLLVES